MFVDYISDISDALNDQLDLWVSIHRWKPRAGSCHTMLHSSETSKGEAKSWVGKSAGTGPYELYSKMKSAVGPLTTGQKVPQAKWVESEKSYAYCDLDWTYIIYIYKH